MNFKLLWESWAYSGCTNYGKCFLPDFNCDEHVKSLNGTLVCHSRESGNRLFQILTSFWIPAFAGMTTICECINCKKICRKKQLKISQVILFQV
jgi:hypothetical protein